MRLRWIGPLGRVAVLTLFILAARPASLPASWDSEPERNAEISLIVIQRYIDDPDIHKDHLKKILGDSDVLNYGYAQTLTLMTHYLIEGEPGWEGAKEPPLDVARNLKIFDLLDQLVRGGPQLDDNLDAEEIAFIAKYRELNPPEAKLGRGLTAMIRTYVRAGDIEEALKYYRRFDELPYDGLLLDSMRASSILVFIRYYCLRGDKDSALKIYGDFNSLEKSIGTEYPMELGLEIIDGCR